MMRLLLVTGLLLAQGAWASKIIGNGGDVVICDRRTPAVIQLLDFYEAQKIRDLRLVDPEGRTYRDKLVSLARKISRRFPELAETIVADISVFENRSRIMDDIVLNNVDDSYHNILPPNCRIEQIAIQKPPVFKRDPLFIISAELWNRMDEFNKAGLVLHEIIYRLGLRHGVEHSLGVRYVVGLMFSTEFESASDYEWIQAFLQARLKYYEIGGVRFPLFTGERGPCMTAPGATTCQNPDPLRFARVEYTADERILSIDYEENSRPDERVTFTSQNTSVMLTTNRVQFVWDSDQLKVRLSGRGQIVSRASPSQGLVSQNVELRGEFTSAEGVFRGTRALLDTSLRSYSGTVNEFQGPFWQLLRDLPTVPSHR